MELIWWTAEVLHDQWREYRYQDEKDQEPATDQSDLVPFEPHPGDLPERAALRRPGTRQHGLRNGGLSRSTGLRRNCQLSLLPRSNVARKVSESAYSALAVIAAIRQQELGKRAQRVALCMRP